MKKVLLALLGILLLVGVLAGAGFAGYRIGYMKGATVNVDGKTQFIPRGGNFDPQRMPMHNLGNGFDHGYGMPGPGMHNNKGFGFFAPFQFIWHIVIFGFIIWFFYWLFTKSGLHVSFKREPGVETPAVEASAAPKKKNEKSDT